MEADHMLATTRSVRRRLDVERDVPDDVLRECLELALQAPTASLRQDWHFVVSNDRDQCRQVGEVYKRIWLGMVTDDYLAASAERESDETAKGDWLNMMGSARHLAENFPEIPAILVPCVEGRMDGASAMTQAVKWGSIIQATWSFMLAGRARGLGTCWTTVHLAAEEEVADILGIPFAEMQQAALIPIAYTIGSDFKPGRRKPFDDFVHWNRW
ncbi:MAG: nitroreductase family protein [Acidimicrobiales bacterium]